MKIIKNLEEGNQIHEGLACGKTIQLTGKPLEWYISLRLSLGKWEFIFLTAFPIPRMYPRLRCSFFNKDNLRGFP